MTDLIIANPEGFANFTIPPWTTAEFIDADGNVVAHFDQPRGYEKVDASGHHTTKFTDSTLYKFPMTVKFTQHEPVAAHTDGTF